MILIVSFAGMSPRTIYTCSMYTGFNVLYCFMCIPLMLLRSIDANSLMPIPLRMTLNEPSLPAPEHVINYTMIILIKPQHTLYTALS